MRLALAGLAIAAAWFDWRTRRVPNQLTVSAIAAGPLLGLLTGGWRAALVSVAIVVTVIVVGFPLHQLRVMGGGDVKLIAAIGAIAGWPLFLEILGWSLAIGTTAAILQLAWARALIPFLRRLAKAGWYAVVWQLESDEPVVEGSGHRMPLAISIGLATLVAIIASERGFQLF